MKKKFLAFIKSIKPCFHKSDGDYGEDSVSGDTLSYCVKCEQCINHSEAPWPVLYKSSLTE